MLAIALGDPTGIGPEVALKAIAEELPRDNERYLLVGDSKFARDLNERFRIGISIEDHSANSSARVTVTNPISALPPSLPAGSPEAARAALAWLKHGAEFCMRGNASVLITAPVNKEAI